MPWFIRALQSRTCGAHQHHTARSSHPLEQSSGGSVGMNLDTCRSDHDLIVEIEDGDVHMVDKLHAIILELQADPYVINTFQRFAKAKVVRKDFAVSLLGYYRSLDFDLVPVTYVEGLDGPRQYDPKAGRWQLLPHPRLADKLQHIESWLLPGTFAVP
eukprot:gb/GFBE01044330.1/.p1 GENE.gb/GFBE01044330.1/~~gb/GFBE01044330.1/.p1  ORF type:complete len:158 (+),score=20.23 gb/GFBE01044330.1/:1-474(+)